MERKKTNLRQVLASNIKMQRKIMGISQERLAEMAGLSWQTINSIECQRAWVSDKTLESLANVLKVENFQLLIPSEIRVILSTDTINAIRKLTDAKSYYDEKVNEILHKK